MVSGMSPVVMKQVFDTISEATGVDLREVMKANTLEAKTDRNVTLKNIPDIKIVSEKESREQ